MFPVDQVAPPFLVPSVAGDIGTYETPAPFVSRARFGGAIVLLVRGLPESPRQRKRAIAALVVIAAGLVAALLGLHFRNTAKPEKETFERGQAQVTHEQVPTRLAATDRRAILALVNRFVEDGVAGKNLPAAYDLSTDNLKGGLSREQWSSGQNPIYRYPVFKHGVRIAASYKNDVMVQLYLRARTRKVDPLGVDVEVLAFGKGPARHWLVDYFQPRETLVTAADRPRGGPEPKDPGIGPHLTQTWLLVPLGIFGLIVLLPVGLGVHHWVTARAAERQYGQGRELPPLPSRTEREN
jgi:hypothetical protein